MICAFCNKEIPDDSKVCPMCGVRLVDAEEVAEPVTEAAAPVVEAVPVEEVTPVTEPETAVIDFSPVAPEPQKGMPKAVKWLLGLGIPVVAIVLVVCLLLPNLFPGGISEVSRAAQGYYIKSSGDANKYLQFVETEGLAEDVTTATNFYGRFLNSYANRFDTSSEGALKIELGQKGYEFLGSTIFANPEAIKWLQNANIDFDINSKDKNLELDLGLSINGQEIVAGEAILAENGDIYAQAPAINKQPIVITGGLNAILGLKQDNGLTVQSLLFGTDFAKYLPDAKVIDKILNRYIALAFDCVENATMAEEELKVGEVGNTYTAITVDFDEKLLTTIATKALEEAKKDEDIKNVLQLVHNFLADKKIFDQTNDTFDETYTKFLESIDKSLGEITSHRDKLEGNGEHLFSLKTFVDGGSNVVGYLVQRPYKINETETQMGTVAQCYEVTNGKDYGFTLAAAPTGSTMRIEAIGTKSGNKVSINDGRFSALGVVGSEIHWFDLLKFTTKDLNTADLKNGIFNGSITFEMGDGLWQAIMVNSNATTLPELEDVKSDMPWWLVTALDLKLKLEGKGNNLEDTNLVLSVLLNDELFAALSLGAESDKGESISAPAKDSCADIIYGAEWTPNFDSIKDNLKKAGVPAELVDSFMGGKSTESSVKAR